MRWMKWPFLAAWLAGGAVLPSCGTDLRDSVLIGVLDAVSGTITESIGAALPLPEWISAALYPGA